MADDHPKVLTYPPIVFAVGIGLGYLIQWLLPLRVTIREPWNDAGGIVFMFAGLAIILWASLAMRAVKTAVDPFKPTTAIVTSGPYKFTRNPIYASWLPVVFGLSLITGTWWPFLMMIPTYAFVDRFIVRPEERYLRAKFPEEYGAYSSTVRRWL